MMDGSSDFLSEKYQERPIILSPPPVAASVTMTFPQSGQTQNFQAQRNQSVGYNLQQEFEALKADLDLDLSYSNATETIHDGLNGSSGPASRSETRSGETSDSLPAADVSLSSPGTGAPLHGPGSSTNSANSSGNGHVMSPPPSASTGNGSRVLSGGPSLLAPAANSPYSMAGHSHLNNHGHLNSHTPLSDALMRERSALSPSSSVGGTVGGPGLSSLLMNKNPGFASSLGSMPSRPQSVNDFSSILPRQQSGQAFSRLAQSGNFYSDMLATTNWIENLSPQDIMTMLDYWCNNNTL
ncbi:hypothetical protein JCM33374_g442 [Metschnikowia sp. JCM 33374]|nr:hypothetical protein JCM33374_g442 [Metschnikowia sp. JCM 33374]